VRATVGGFIVPVLCGAAFKNNGVQAMLDDSMGSAPFERSHMQVLRAMTVESLATELGR
jgi:translation elongation factor EF-G